MKRSRAGGVGTGAATGAGVPCAGPVWKRWCGRPRAWRHSWRGVTCPLPPPETPRDPLPRPPAPPAAPAARPSW